MRCLRRLWRTPRQPRYVLRFIRDFEIRERLVGGRRCRFAGLRTWRGIQVPGALDVVAVQAQQFPVAAVGRVVVVVMVSVMQRELAQVLAREFARAAAANPRIELERSLSIVLLALLPVASHLGDDLVQPVVIPFAHLDRPNLPHPRPLWNSVRPDRNLESLLWRFRHRARTTGYVCSPLKPVIGDAIFLSLERPAVDGRVRAVIPAGLNANPCQRTA